MYCQCHERTDDKQQEGDDVQSDAALLERCEESGADLHAQGVDEQDETEILYHREHVRIDGKSEMSGDDAGKEDKCHPERHSADLYLSQRQSDSADDREYENSLNKGLFGEYFYKPVHFLIDK